MNILVKHFAIAACLLLGNAITFIQNHLITWSEHTSLQWDDFSGKVNDSSHFEAECFTEIRYSYKCSGPKGFQFTVTAFFDKNASWIKPDNKCEALLKHEQVHFDIAQLYACRLQQAFEEYPYTSNYTAEIEQIFDKVNKEYHDTQELYDIQSNHSLLEAQQKKWEAYVEEALMNVNTAEPNW